MSNKLKIKSFITFLGIACALFLGNSSSLAAVLPYGTIITDDKGITVSSNGNYLIDISNALPGETYEKEFVIRTAEKVDPYELSLRVNKESSSGVIDWNEHVKMTLVLGDKVIYQGKILGDKDYDLKQEGIIIGNFKYGTEERLLAKFEIDKALTNEDFSEKNILEYQWTFIATRNGVPITDNSKPKKDILKLPQTGEEWREFIYRSIAGILLILLTILIWKNRRKNTHG